MNRSRLLLAFLAYLTLDLSNPFVPGAFSFDPGDCVEGVHYGSSSFRRVDAPALAAQTPVARVESSLPSSLRRPAGRRHAVLEWLIDARADTRAASDPPPPGDDH